MGFVKFFRDGFGFLFFDPRFFAVILLFYLFMHLFGGSFSVDSVQVADLDLAPRVLSGLVHVFFAAFILAFLIEGAAGYVAGGRKTKFTQDTLKRNFMPLLAFKLVLYALSLTASVIMLQALQNAQADQGMSGSDAFSFMVASFFLNIVPVFLFMLTPVAIVLEKETLIGGVRKALGILKDKPLYYLAFFIVLHFFFGVLFTLPLQIDMLYRTLNGSELSIPGMEYLIIVFNAASFVFYTASMTGFYMERSKK